MINLQEKLKQARAAAATAAAHNNNNHDKSIPIVQPKPASRHIRDVLLQKEVPEMSDSLPATCKLHFPNEDQLHTFELVYQPTEGYWKGGKFRFMIHVPEQYNMLPPRVECRTRIWHPNIDEQGKVCLSLLRVSQVDRFGWLPTRRLVEVAWGLLSLFSDLCDFSDPLNTNAAEEMRKDEAAFQRKVRLYISQYAS